MIERSIVDEESYIFKGLILEGATMTKSGGNPWPSCVYLLVLPPTWGTK